MGSGRGQLPRLGRDAYRGRAVVHWTQAVDGRSQGWLDEAFCAAFREVLLHACCRQGLVCPVFCLMPDHFHLLWLGISASSDQWVAIEFLRRETGGFLGEGQRWQRQPYDHVLRLEERGRDALAAAIAYVLNNPVRAGLVGTLADYPFSGCVVAGYPRMDPKREEFWPVFWRVYHRLVQASDARDGDRVAHAPRYEAWPRA